MYIQLYTAAQSCTYIKMYINLHVAAKMCTFKCKLQHKSAQCVNNCTLQNKGVHYTYNFTLQHKGEHTHTAYCIVKVCTLRYNCMFKYKLLNKGAHCSTEMHTLVHTAAEMCKYTCTLRHKGVISITRCGRSYVHCTPNCKLRHKGVQKTEKSQIIYF